MSTLNLNNQGKEELRISAPKNSIASRDMDEEHREYIAFLEEPEPLTRSDSIIIVNESDSDRMHSLSHRNHYDDISSALYSKPKPLTLVYQSITNPAEKKEPKKLTLETKKNPFSATLVEKVKSQTPLSQTKQLYTIFEKVSPRYREQVHNALSNKSPYLQKELNKSKSREHVNNSMNSKQNGKKPSKSQEKKPNENKLTRRKNLLDQITKIAEIVSVPSTAASTSGASSLGKVFCETPDLVKAQAKTDPQTKTKKTVVPGLKLITPTIEVGLPPNNFLSQREVYYHGTTDSARGNANSYYSIMPQNKSGLSLAKTYQIDSSREYQLERNSLSREREKSKTSQKVAKLKKKIPDSDVYFINEYPNVIKPRLKEQNKEKALKFLVSTKDNKCSTPEIQIDLGEKHKEKHIDSHTSSLKMRIAETLQKRKINNLK